MSEDTEMELQRSVGRIEGAITALVSRVDAVLHAQAKLNTRVTSLETWRNYILGGGAVLTFLLALVTELFGLFR